ncbi:MAG: sulfatase-like hydrolase/transferase [Saprospiraceae bacterium]|nr:sulfatase-like hydrolase/transferase [Saprospiraceae bacterium]
MYFNFSTRILLIISLLAAKIYYSQVWSKANSSTEVDPPNILIILTDDQGYHDVSYYGTSDLYTPHIDALVKDGIRFDNFYANCPVCSPTRAALLTGRYQEYVGVPGVIRTNPKNSWGFLDPEALMLPQLLAARGYHTALIGKWHLGLQSPNTPNERGFAFFHGWLGDMMDDYVQKRRHDINYMRENEETIDLPGHATDLFTQWSVDYIKERAVQESPFFLYLAYNAPHFPVQPPEEWLEKVRARDSTLTEKRAKLIAFIEHLDSGIGKVVEALKESGQYENTIIVFSSDNGGLLADEANNGPYRDGKQSLYEGGLRVPTSVTWRNVIQPGSATEHVSLSMDIFPTLLDLCDVDLPTQIEGRSFAPVLTGGSVDHAKRPFFFSRREGGARYGGLTIQAVRLGKWKLLQNSPFTPQELYDLSADPREQHNVIDKYPEVYKKLNALLMAHLQKGGEVPWQSAKSDE